MILVFINAVNNNFLDFSIPFVHFIPSCIRRRTEAAARSRHRRTFKYVEERDEETTKVSRRRQLSINNYIRAHLMYRGRKIGSHPQICLYMPVHVY